MKISLFIVMAYVYLAGLSRPSSGCLRDALKSIIATLTAMAPSRINMYSALSAAEIVPDGVVPPLLMMFPTRIGTDHIPRFCTQYISEYAVPRFFSGTIFGTDGHIADGTSEYPVPRSPIAIYA